MTEPQARVGGRIGQRERAMLLVLLVVALAAGAFAVVTMLGGDDEPLTPDVGAPATPSPRRTPTPAPTTAPETFGAFAGRDPFQPLVREPDAAEPVDADGDGTPDPTPPSEGGTGGRRVALLDIFRQDGVLTATVEVDGREINLQEGDTFADNFRLDNLTEECADFTFGDEGFRLCVGQETRK